MGKPVVKSLSVPMAVLGGGCCAGCPAQGPLELPGQSIPFLSLGCSLRLTWGWFCSSLTAVLGDGMMKGTVQELGIVSFVLSRKKGRKTRQQRQS